MEIEKKDIEYDEEWEHDYFNPGISKDEWVQLLNDKKIFDENSLTLIKRIYYLGGEASCKQLSKEYGNKPDDYRNWGTSLAKRVHDRTNCKLFSDGKKTEFYSVLFKGKKSGGYYIWKLRPELEQAIEEVNLLDIPPDKKDKNTEIKQDREYYMDTKHALNQILYGPPGTGKTYNTVIEAIKIIDNTIIKYDEQGKVINYPELKKKFDEYKKQGRIEFITFHQSYSYEEFVEGIKPYISQDNWLSDEDEIIDEDNKNIKYIGKKGIFRNICERAGKPIIEKIDNDLFFDSNANIWKVSLMGTGNNPIRKYCMENDCIRIGWDKYGETITDETVFDEGGSRVLNSFITKMNIGDIVLSCYSENTIDAIGVITSDYKWNDEFDRYKRVRDVKWLIKDLNHNILDINNNTKFTLSTVYELKNISIKAVIDIINSKNKSITYKENDKKYVLIIDEINRGNISKIFGELITLIEPDKRIGEKHELKVNLPYSHDLFGIPKNLYIIGTMNTADKSLALLDVALRRRFEFVPMYPKYEPEIKYAHIEYSNILNELNKNILKEKKSADYLIGHSYFMEDDSLENIFNHKVIPLLMEYFNGKTKDVQKLLKDIISVQSLEFDDKYKMPDKDDEYYYLQVKQK